MNKTEMLEFSTMVANAVVDAITKANITGIALGNATTGASGNTNEKEPLEKRIKYKSAYAKTEALLYNYNAFQKIVKERELEIQELREHGVPKSTSFGGQIKGKGGTPKGIVLEEESVESAVLNVQRSVEVTVQALALIDKCMEALKDEPYYEILPMLYIEGRTQEDIADYYGVSQVSISKNKHRLVKELSLRLFPNQAIAEMMQ